MYSKKEALYQHQKKLFQTIVLFDQLCRENGIKYSLHGGTLLGAVREKGFIEWDDDLDISMTREEFSKLLDCLRGKNIFRLEYALWTSRLKFIEDKTGAMSLDIFIWDFISEKVLLQKIKLLLIRFLQGTLKEGIERKKYTFQEKILIYITYFIGKLIPKKIKISTFEYISKKVFLGNKKLIHRSNDNFKGVAEIFELSCMNHYEDTLFEGHPLMVSKEHKKFLIKSYGEDYMTPVPVEERVPSHNFIAEEIE